MKKIFFHMNQFDIDIDRLIFIVDWWFISTTKQIKFGANLAHLIWNDRASLILAFSLSFSLIFTQKIQNKFFVTADICYIVEMAAHLSLSSIFNLAAAIENKVFVKIFNVFFFLNVRFSFSLEWQICFYCFYYYDDDVVFKPKSYLIVINNDDDDFLIDIDNKWLMTTTIIWWQ